MQDIFAQYFVQMKSMKSELHIIRRSLNHHGLETETLVPRHQF